MLQVLSALCLLLPIAFGNNLDSAGQKTCLTEHNNYRAELAKGNVVAASGKLPAAANMNELVNFQSNVVTVSIYLDLRP